MTQRQIKFRAWEESKESNDGGKTYKDEGFMLSWKEIKEEGLEFFFDDKTPLMQFTGLYDKNGKEIYEGDILRDDAQELFEVKFGTLPLDKSGDCVCHFEAFYAKGYGKLGRAPQHECNYIGEWMEIIGNIYQNPELLK